MRVLILANNDIGLYRFRKELLKELILNNIEVYISLPDGKMIKQLQDIGCVFCATDVDRRGMNPIKDLKLFFYYIKMIKKMKPDVVLTYTIKPNIYGGIACRLMKIRYIANVTGLGTALEKQGLLSKMLIYLYKIALGNAQQVFFQNKSNKELFLEKKISKKGYLIPGSGVNLEENCYEVYPDKTKPVSFLFVGRIMKDKGIEELLSCAEYIKSKYRDVQFHLVGPYDEEQYKDRINQMHDQKLLISYGEQSDIHGFMKECHAIILPSYHEGLSNVLLEGAACGRPLLTTTVPGCRETYDEGITGFGCEAGNEKALIAIVEKFLALSYEEKVEMGKLGRQKVKKIFDRNIIVDAYMNEIRKGV